MTLTLKLSWPPKELSPNARNHWAKTAKFKKQLREKWAWEAAAQGAYPSNAQSLHVTLTFYPLTRRRVDLDNLLSRAKAGIDGLADVLRVDDSKWTLSIQKAETTGGYVEVKIEEKN